jgi:hypothetical protein
MWLYAINAITISRKGISALQLQRELGMKTYTAAWRMMHRIRKAISKDEIGFLSGIVEIDETYIGGKPRKFDNEKHKRGRGHIKNASRWNKRT